MLCVIFGLIELGLAIYGGYMLVQRAKVWIDEAIDDFYDWLDGREKRRHQRAKPVPPPPQPAAYSPRVFTPISTAAGPRSTYPYGYERQEAVSDGPAVTTVTPQYEPEPEYKPRRAYYPEPGTKEADGFETQPFTTTWQADSISKAEMTESMLILEADDGETFTVDETALPDYVHELQKNGYDVEVTRTPDSDPAQYVLKLKKRRY